MGWVRLRLLFVVSLLAACGPTGGRSPSPGFGGGGAVDDGTGGQAGPGPVGSGFDFPNIDGGLAPAPDPCATPGVICDNGVEVDVCGNGKLSVTRGERCDDGNVADGDGCSAACMLEPDFSCPQPGMPCVSTVNCGDGRVSGAEACDDGNRNAGDGCAPDCRLENGWACPMAGSCRAARCGDGVIAGGENCDDGNARSGDGCGSDCRVESPAVNEANAWSCPQAGMACQRTTCGNGVPEGSEQCDDGNNDSGDGCSPFCRREPICPPAGGPCTTACGDGLLLPVDVQNGQECDDGNTQPLDGCSADCKVEPGYACTGMPLVADPLVLPIVYRDMKAVGEPNGHPDFEAFEGYGAEFGIVEPMLGPDGKPRHVAGQKFNSVNNDPGVAEDFFSYWYRDTPAYTRTIKDTLTFTSLGGGQVRFDDSSFFPIDGRGWGNWGNSGHNFHFTSEVRYWFEYKGGETLEFRGDDDLWVFINRRLAVDLGGLHAALTASVILAADGSGNGLTCDLLTPDCAQRRTVALGLEVGKVYEIVVFQAERRAFNSNYRLTLTNFSGTRSLCAPVCGDGVVTPNEACDLGTAKNTGAYGTCNANCSLPARCGDGMVSNGEQCDDGINAGGYGGCQADCTRGPFCGDGMKNGPAGQEACDLGMGNEDNPYGAGKCTGLCQAAPYCGDGIIQTSAGETCDGQANCTSMCRVRAID